MSEKLICKVCPRHCAIADGETGACGVRENRGGENVCGNYGKIAALALDPIEKKPLAMYKPGSYILSVGSFGCNMFCPFCQNSDISHPGRRAPGEHAAPDDLVRLAVRLKDQGNIGIAFTYNEALTGYEFVRDTASLAKSAGLDTVLVTNGCFSKEVLAEVLPYIDAMNVDIKSFREEVYKEVLGGDLACVKDFIEAAVSSCHVELTSLIVPGMNDSEDEMRELAAWIAGLDGGEGKIPLHVTRCFPAWKWQGLEPTDVGLVYRLADVASEHLEHVFVGNC
ncbi:MAG: radical SAM protein [Eubacteriales bacterium]|nr:radical SAM protein [Eubacteriales bacterium]